MRLAAVDAKLPFCTDLLTAPASEPVGVGARTETDAVGAKPVPEVDAPTVVLEFDVAAVAEVVPVAGVVLLIDELEPLVGVGVDVLSDVEPATGGWAPAEVEALAVGVVGDADVGEIDVDAETDPEVVEAVVSAGVGVEAEVETATLAELDVLPEVVPLVETVALALTVLPVGAEIEDETPMIGSSARAAEGPTMANTIAIPMTARIRPPPPL